MKTTIMTITITMNIVSTLITAAVVVAAAAYYNDNDYYDDGGADCAVFHLLSLSDDNDHGCNHGDNNDRDDNADDHLYAYSEPSCSLFHL